MDVEALREVDSKAPASDYIRGVPGTVGELVEIIDTHGVDGVEAAAGIGPVTAAAIRTALAEHTVDEHANDQEQKDPVVAEIKRRHRAGESHVALAEAFGLMPSRVARIIREE